MKAIRIDENGGPDVLVWRDVPEPEPTEGEVLVDVAAAGVNFIDAYHRSGLYEMELPLVPGLEGAGTVIATGRGVDGVEVGSRVAWCNVLGSYAERVAVPLDDAAPVPAGVSSDVAAAVMLQGLTAHYLSHDTFPLEPGSRCLIHAGAGGVGLLLIQMAKQRGSEVFTTVGSPEKAELASAAGADHVILYRDVDFGDAVEEIAGPHALDVVYDGVGQAVFERSLQLLRIRGMMVQFGNASGAVEPIAPLRLLRGGSLFLTRPSIFHYVTTPQELRSRASDLFSMIEAGDLDVRIGARWPMAEAARAHEALEARQTTGKVLLDP